MNNKSKVIVFYDESNLYYGFEKHNWKVSYEKFVNWLNENYELVSVYFCKGKLPTLGFFTSDLKDSKTLEKFKSFLKEYWINKNILASYEEFKQDLKRYFLYEKLLKREFARLKALGMNIITKIVDIIPTVKTMNGKEVIEFEKKCNFDVEIATIALDRINDYEEMILCSGDGDFAYLVKYLKNKGKKITVVSHADRLSHNLKKATKYIITLGSLKERIQFPIYSSHKKGST